MKNSRLNKVNEAAPLCYRIEAFDPKAHLFRVGLLIGSAALDGQAGERQGDAFAVESQVGGRIGDAVGGYPKRLAVRMAAWIPGSYMIREFAKHVLKLEAYLVDHNENPTSSNTHKKALEISKTAKACWEIEGIDAQLAALAFDPSVQAIYIEALIYAWDLSVRAAHLDQNHGFFNPTSLCLRLEGGEHLPCDLELIAPDPAQVRGHWEVATTLQKHGNTAAWGFGRYHAENYDDLADHPVEMGSFSKFEFQACGVPHWLIVTGRHRFDDVRVCRDLKKICETQIRFFDPEAKAPFDQYMFLLTVLGEGYGGLEHRDSTALICQRDDLPAPKQASSSANQSLSGGLADPKVVTGLAEQSDGKRSSVSSESEKVDEPSEAYQRFLGLASHEYFHAWHVKRIKPSIFARYDFDQENYTRLLWVFEGFTSYYDDLMLLRSGVISKRRYLKSLESTINQVLRNPSRKVQSLAESSFDAWIKYYRQDENAANAVVSYYAKGAIVALCIDLLLRRESNQETSLDDFMRLLWHRYGKDFYHQERPTDNNARGLDEEGFVPLLFEACGIEAIAKREAMTLQIKQWVEGRVELPLGDLLASAGVRLSYKPTALTHGMRYSINQQQMMINAVLIGSAAHEAGLSAGDQILAIDGLRASESRLKEAIERCEAPIDVVAFRRDELFCTTLKLLPETNPEVILEFDTA
ncbi:MAG: M61 family metallopeptidase [Burkholderiales bacterium]